ncbi:MAG: hypothetical protein H6719_18595 [Sandaracinaceae bacterium]|nr:hypothetical protein [Sandaracinaceae bacterium]
MNARLGIALLVLAASACDSTTLEDAGAPPDAATAADAGADASVADAGGMDAGTTDAGPGTGSDAGLTDAGSDAGGMDAGATDAGSDAGATDAGPLTAATACDALCNRLLICAGAPMSELAMCISDCTADLLDCSDPELTTLRACESAPDACDLDPATMAPKLLSCVMTVACVMG